MNRKQSVWATIQPLVKRLKPYLRWAILGGTLFFLIDTLLTHWEDVASIRIDSSGWACLAIALGTTLLAHIWSGWVWSLILRDLHQPASGVWGILVYLKTNIAKYLPGNVWHFYGRVSASKAAGYSTEASTLSVLLEPLLMAAAALLVALIGGERSNLALQIGGLLSVLAIVHPRILNVLLRYVGKLKGYARPKPNPETGTPPSDRPAEITAPPKIQQYPLRPLLGELVFLGLRSAGFLWVVFALESIGLSDIPALISAFSMAWLLGLVIPGAPGGIGVFEATAIALLDGQFSTGLILSSVAIYRLISTLAEAGGAGLAWLDERLNGRLAKDPVSQSGNLES
ncbi:MAG TPA: lysylphosphatidylglycerol synthase domain-containing protein [Elainellaceae cyanobacterium]